MNHPSDNDPAESGTAEDQTEANGSLQHEDGPRGIGWRKGLIIVVAVVTVWTVVESRKRIGWRIEWSDDLDACLDRAQNPRKAVLLLVHRLNCPLMAELDRTVFNLKPTYKWVMKGIPCRLIWQEHPEIIRKYGLTESPSLLCLNPEGEAVIRWSGDAITARISKRDLKYVVGHRDEETYRKPRSTTAPSGRSP